jgi:hypothetical protein
VATVYVMVLRMVCIVLKIVGLVVVGQSVVMVFVVVVSLVFVQLIVHQVQIQKFVEMVWMMILMEISILRIQIVEGEEGHLLLYYSLQLHNLLPKVAQ